MILGRIPCLRALILNRDCIWRRGCWKEGDLKSWRMLRVEGSGWNLVRKISTSPRYGIDITGTDLLSLGKLGGTVNSKKLEKRELTKEWSYLHEISYLEGPRNSDLLFKIPTGSSVIRGGRSWKCLKRRDQDETWWKE